MARAGRQVLAVVAGAVLWAVLWVSGSMALAAVLPGRIEPGVPVTDALVLAVYIAYSVVLSLLAGYVAARVSGGSQKAVWWLAGLQLVLGIAIEASAWSMTPVWYHVVFLVLLVPATVQGGRLYGRRSAVGGAARYA